MAEAAGFRSDIAPTIAFDLLVGSQINHILATGQPPSPEVTEQLTQVILPACERPHASPIEDRQGRTLPARAVGTRLSSSSVTASDKVASMRDAIAQLVHDGDTVAIEGFTHLIWFAAGHEIIRQRKRDLTLARLTPDLIYDQMIAAGVARKLVFSWLGNPGVGGLGAIRRRIEGEIPAEPLEIEEYSHFGMVGRYTAGAMNLPFFPLRTYFETDLPSPTR